MIAEILAETAVATSGGAHAGGELPNRPPNGSSTPAAPRDRTHEVFAGYELLDVLGRGGMGVVYRARQLQPERIVAVKMIRSGRFASAADVQRFHAEAQAAAHLDHEGIVPIYEVGQHAGEHFFSMKFVDGESLGDRLRRRDWPLPAALATLCAVCDAIGHAHQQGVIHRDLKPSNILLDRAGRALVTDFGLAKLKSHDSSLTAAGDIMGTPGYMSPEQARGDADCVTAASDVYSLGAILYQVLTGRPPIVSEPANLLDTLRRIQEEEILPPRAINRRVPRDLETICLKCLEREPERRYADATELAGDLRRYVAGEPIQARPLGWGRRLHRWARQRPGLAATWLTVAFFYLYHSLCYWGLRIGDLSAYYHRASTALALCWCVGAWFFQRRLTRSGGRAVYLYLWATLDVVLLTTFLFATDHAQSPLAPLYPALVASSGLRFRPALVGYVTALALAGYLSLSVFTMHFLPEVQMTWTQAVPFALSLIAIGLVQYLALRRVHEAQAAGRSPVG